MLLWILDPLKATFSWYIGLCSPRSKYIQYVWLENVAKTRISTNIISLYKNLNGVCDAKSLIRFDDTCALYQSCNYVMKCIS